MFFCDICFRRHFIVLVAHVSLIAGTFDQCVHGSCRFVVTLRLRQRSFSAVFSEPLGSCSVKTVTLHDHWMDIKVHVRVQRARHFGSCHLSKSLGCLYSQMRTGERSRGSGTTGWAP